MGSILGIDPGLNGALAFINTDRWTLSVYDMPVSTLTRTKTHHEINAPQVATIVKANDPQWAYLEEVHSSPQMGVASAFNFGDGYGCVKGVLAAIGIPLTKVSPQLWKRNMRAPKDKTEARGRACQLLPDCAGLFARVMDDGRAEASLIALFGVLEVVGNPPQKIVLEV